MAMSFRPSALFLLAVLLLAGAAAVIALRQHEARGVLVGEVSQYRELVQALGLTDLALTTEARYTRHPAVSDGVVVHMDHPRAVDHFPSTLFVAPVQ